MYSLFVFFIPSILGVKLIDYFGKGLSLKNTLYTYVYLLTFSFMGNVTVAYKLFEITGDIFQTINSYPMLFVKMALVSIVINVVFAFIWLIVRKNVEFKIEVVENEKKNKANTKSSKKASTKVRKSTPKTRKSSTKNN